MIDTKSVPSLNEPSTIPAEPPTSSIPSSDALKLNVPITNQPSDVPADPQFLTTTIATNEEQTNNESISVDNADAKSKESQVIEEHKESLPLMLDPSLPAPSTDNPIEIEVPYPELDSVTPDPFGVDNSDKPILSEDSLKYDLPSNLMPEFKDLEESAEVKVEEPASGSILGGLGGIFPIFNAGDDQDDSINVNSSEEDKTHVLESGTTSNGNIENSDENNDVYFEDNTQNSIPMSIVNIVNSGGESKENVETIENESSDSFFSGITSFFSSNSADEGSDKAAQEVSDPSAKDLAANILDTSTVTCIYILYVVLHNKVLYFRLKQMKIQTLTILGFPKRLANKGKKRLKSVIANPKNVLKLPNWLFVIKRTKTVLNAKMKFLLFSGNSYLKTLVLRICR